MNVNVVVAAKILGILSIWPILGLGISAYKQRKDFDFGTWFLNIIRSLQQFLKSFLGVWLLEKSGGHAGDSKWVTIAKSDHEQAMAYARERMIDEGIVYPEAYIPRFFDCENFAHTMKTFYDIWFLLNRNTIGKGLPSSVRGFRKTDTINHAVLVAEVEGETVWEEVYPNHPRKFDLTPKQKATSWAVTKG